MIDLDKIKYEGTENLLTEYSEDDKKKIIDIANRIRRSMPKYITRKVLEDIADFDGKRSGIVTGINFMIDWYSKNLPKGFKRPKNIWQMANKDGVCLNFNRNPIVTRLHYKGYVSTTLNYIKPVKVKVKGVEKTKVSVGSFVHSLVALAWIPNPKNKAQVNHRDGVKTNNKVSNLEWNTNLENIRHATRNGLRDTVAMRANGNGEKNSQAKVNKRDVIEIRRIHKLSKIRRVLELAEEFNCSDGDIYLILANKYKKALPMPMVPKDVKTSRGNSSYRTMVRKYDSKSTEGYIRGEMERYLRELSITLAKTYGISTASVRDIFARRSWDYQDC